MALYKNTKHSESGFTLVEIVIGLALASLISLMLASNMEMIARSMNHMKIAQDKMFLINLINQNTRYSGACERLQDIVNGFQFKPRYDALSIQSVHSLKVDNQKYLRIFYKEKGLIFSQKEKFFDVDIPDNCKV